MKTERWDQKFGSHREFYEATYGHAIVESRDVSAANASMFYCLQGAGDWSDAETPDLVVSLQRTTRSSGRCDVGAGAFSLSPSKARGILVPPNTPTSIHMDAPHDILVAAIPFESLNQLLPEVLPRNGDFGPAHAKEIDDPFVYALVERLWAESETGNLHGKLFAEGALAALAASLLRLSEIPTEKLAARGGLAPWQVRRATEALRSLLTENVSLTFLAAEVGLSPFHFSRAFKKSLGVPPHRYRTRLRMEKACQLLETTDASVTDIAFKVGYESSQALARIFARDLRVTPTEWRRERRR